jgi:AAA domain
MNPSPVVYPFAELAARLDLSPEGASAPAKTTATIVSFPLAGRPAITAQSRLNAAACAGLVDVEAIDEASRYYPAVMPYLWWRDNWLFPIASAIALAPEHTERLRQIFDRENRRTADPTKANEGYFADTLYLLNHAVANGVAKNNISHSRIPQTAAAYGYGSGATVAQTAAAITNGSPPTTVVRGSGLTAVFGAAAPFFDSVPSDQADLSPVTWLVLGLLLRGEITLLAGQGGSAKTALAVLIAVALAAGRQQLGPWRIKNKPEGLRVAYISAEEDANRFGLLTAAACNVLALGAAERALVKQNLLFHDAAASGLRIGEARPGQREDIAPESEDRALHQLTAALVGVDVLILDTLAALLALPNENDNSTGTTLMRRLGRAARQADCAVMLIHHTPKMTREVAAQQRGEPTLVRGASAFVNSARIVLTATSLSAAEGGQFVMQGKQPDRARRLDHAKINDLPMMDPAYFEVVSEKVPVCDGSKVPVRAVEFIAAPAAGAGGITDAARNVVMKTVDAGAVDDHGTKVPLSPGGGRNKRDATTAIARALINANAALTEPQAKHLGREVLKDLMDRIGCVIDQPAQIPQYRKTGQPNGTQTGRGLVARWDLAPWIASSAVASPAAPDTTLGGTPVAEAAPCLSSCEPPVNASDVHQERGDDSGGQPPVNSPRGYGG